MASTPEPTVLAAPRLIETRTPSSPSGVVLVLHGGHGRGTVPVSARQTSVLRMVPIAARIAGAGHGRLAVFRLLNAYRGVGENPLADIRWALQKVRTRYPGVEVGLVGHSLGGTMALRAVAEPSVASVVALAPWLSDRLGRPERIKGVRILVAHGARDRVTSPQASADWVRTARSASTDASFVEVAGGEHTMLKRLAVFDGLAAAYTTATLLDGSVGSSKVRSVVAEALAGKSPLEI